MRSSKKVENEPHFLFYGFFFRLSVLNEKHEFVSVRRRGINSHDVLKLSSVCVHVFYYKYSVALANFSLLFGMELFATVAAPKPLNNVAKKMHLIFNLDE